MARKTAAKKTAPKKGAAGKSGQRTKVPVKRTTKRIPTSAKLEIDDEHLHEIPTGLRHTLITYDHSTGERIANDLTRQEADNAILQLAKSRGLIPGTGCIQSEVPNFSNVPKSMSVEDRLYQNEAGLDTTFVPSNIEGMDGAVLMNRKSRYEGEKLAMAKPIEPPQPKNSKMGWLPRALVDQEQQLNDCAGLLSQIEVRLGYLFGQQPDGMDMGKLSVPIDNHREALNNIYGFTGKMIHERLVIILDILDNSL